MPTSTAVWQNRLLNRLGADDLARLRPDLKKVQLTLGKALHPAGAAIEQVYFPESGMVSILTVMRTGEQIETAIIGHEGVVGGWVAITAGPQNTQSTVQMAGSAFQISSAKFIAMYRDSEQFRFAVNEYQNIILIQAQQSAGCHAIHSVEARFCRWILLSQDIIQSKTIPLTQEFLSHMLGVQRSSVSLTAHALREAGLIKYSRGKIEILDRKAIEECACECYSIINDAVRTYLAAAR